MQNINLHLFQRERREALHKNSFETKCCLSEVEELSRRRFYERSE